MDSPFFFDGHGVFIVPKDNQHVCLASNGRENQLTLARVAEQDSCKWQYFEITYRNTLAVCFMINELIDGKIMCADVSGPSMENNARIIMFPVRWMNTQRQNQLWIPEIDATA